MERRWWFVVYIPTLGCLMCCRLPRFNRLLGLKSLCTVVDTPGYDLVRLKVASSSPVQPLAGSERSLWFLLVRILTVTFDLIGGHVTNVEP